MPRLALPSLPAKNKIEKKTFTFLGYSNQIGKVPPEGAGYDRNTKRIVVDPEQQDGSSQPDERCCYMPNDITV